MTLNEIRRRPTLPGRFQPSTISVLRLNFCVRDGNRWIPQAIVTGNLLCKSLSLPPFLSPSVRPSNGLLTSFELGFRFKFLCTSDALSLTSRLAFSAPSKPHRLEFLLPSDHDFRFSPSKLLLCFFASLLSRLRFQRFPRSRVFFAFTLPQIPGLSFRLKCLASLSSPSLSLQLSYLHSTLLTLHSLCSFFLRSSPRPISIIKLHTLPRFHR